MVLVFASNNAQKLEEVRAMMPAGIDVLSLRDIGFEAEIDETGTTLEENSRIKASTVAAFIGERLEVIESPYAEKILRNALYEDDYVFSSGESSWKNRWHIVTNLFKYRWKYEEIYQQSVWKQLWWYASGFIFKTE